MQDEGIEAAVRALYDALLPELTAALPFELPPGVELRWAPLDRPDDQA